MENNTIQNIINKEVNSASRIRTRSTRATKTKAREESHVDGSKNRQELEPQIRLTRVDMAMSALSSNSSWIDASAKKRSIAESSLNRATETERSRSTSRTRKEEEAYLNFNMDFDHLSDRTEIADLPGFSQLTEEIDQEYQNAFLRQEQREHQQQQQQQQQQQMMQQMQQPQQLKQQQTEEEALLLAPNEKRGKGCPPSTGEYAKKKERTAKKVEEQELQKEKDILDPIIKPRVTKSYMDFLKLIKDKAMEYKYTPIPDLEALVSEKSTDIYKVAANSGTMKGTFIKLAKEAAADMCAAATVLATKAQNPQATPVEEQLEELKHQLHQLRMENAQLRRMLEQSRRKGVKGTASQKFPQPLRPFTMDDYQSPQESTDDYQSSQERTKRWVKENSPPPNNGGASTAWINPAIETPLPSPGGEFPTTLTRANGATLPPKGGDAPNTLEERMDIEILEPAPIFVEEDFPALVQGRGKKGRRSMQTSSVQITSNGIAREVKQDPNANEEKRKQEMLIALVEGVCERLMDKRLGNPVPTYSQMKEAEKGQGRQTKTKPNPKVISQDNKIEKEPKPGKPKIVNITTLNPPAKMYKSAIREMHPAQKTKGEKAPKKKKEDKEVVIAQQPLQTTEASKSKEGEWAQVVSRNTKRREKGTAEPKEGGKEKPNKGKGPETRKAPIIIKKTGPQPKKEPKSAAITITCPPGKYGEVMREARNHIDIDGMGIQGVKITRAITGALKLEISGKDAHQKADALAAKLRGTIGRKEGVRIDRPTKTAEIRIRGLEDSTNPPEILAAIAEAGNCEMEEVRIGETRRTPGGMGIIWARCPTSAANRIMATGKIKIGWAITRVELLADRPLQCYKCLEGGHVRQRCPNKEDRSDRCYRCGQQGHTARECEEAPNCPVCRDKNLPSNHRTGSKSCTPVQKGRRGIALNRVVYGTGPKRQAQDTENPRVRGTNENRNEDRTGHRGKRGEASLLPEGRETSSPQGKDGVSPPLESGETPPLHEERGKKIGESPKEQRTRRPRERKRGEDSDSPKEGGGQKKRRLKESIEDRASSAMETESEDGKDPTKENE